MPRIRPSKHPPRPAEPGLPISCFLKLEAGEDRPRPATSTHMPASCVLGLIVLPSTDARRATAMVSYRIATELLKEKTLITLATRIAAGFKSGIEHKNPSFLGLLAISLLLPTTMVLAVCLIVKELPTWSFIVGIGPSFWVLISFCAYLLAIACLQSYHRSAGNEKSIQSLARQVDLVVSAMLVALLVSLLSK